MFLCLRHNHFETKDGFIQQANYTFVSETMCVWNNVRLGQNVMMSQRTLNMAKQNVLIQSKIDLLMLKTKYRSLKSRFT